MVGFGLLVAVWWAAVAIFDIQPYMLPSPPDVADAFLRTSKDMLKETGYTLIEVLLGFGLAVVVAGLIASAIRASPILNKTLYPLVLAVNSVPKVAVAPLMVMWMGYGLLPRSMLVFLICFFPIVISSATGLGATPAELIELGRSLEATRWQTFVKIRLPSALPQVFVGLKVAMTLAVIGAVVAEFQGGTSGGLGFLILMGSGQGNTAEAFACITLLAIISIALYYALVWLERLLLPWAPSRTSQGSM
jgi:NitT/TauT family transport system permease protein